MGIFINDFQVAMETYGATRLPNREGSRYPVSVPCFQVGNGVALMHSGSYYIVQRDNKAPKKIMDQAMAEFGEKHPGGSNFWWGEIHSIPGVLTLASMLDGKYSKELVNQLTNETYKKLLCNSKVKNNISIKFTDINTTKMQQLRQVLTEYSYLVNPFSNNQLNFRDPIDYLDKVQPVISAEEKPLHLELTAGRTHTYHTDKEDGWCYQSTVIMQKNRRCKDITISHYYNSGKDNRPIDEVIYIDYNDRAESGYYTHPDDVDLRISLKTGLAWKTYHEDQAMPVTDEQLDFAITCVKESMKRIKRKIVNKMVIPA